MNKNDYQYENRNDSSEAKSWVFIFFLLAAIICPLFIPFYLLLPTFKWYQKMR